MAGESLGDGYQAIIPAQQETSGAKRGLFFWKEGLFRADSG